MPASRQQGVVYKDTDFLAIDKPMGWTVNPGFLGGDPLVGGLVAIVDFPIYWVANHPN